MMVKGGEEFLAFARRAKPGEPMVYGRGEAPSREAVRAMQDLVEAGVLHPVRKREGDSWLFLVQRGHGDLAGLRRSTGRRGAVRRRRMKKTSLTMVLDCLTRAARRSEPCPTNDELAARCGLSGKLAASYRVRRLVAAGKIALVDHSPYGRRVVTILQGRHAGAQTREAAI
jgi:hypothetical protein